MARALGTLLGRSVCEPVLQHRVQRRLGRPAQVADVRNPGCAQHDHRPHDSRAARGPLAHARHRARGCGWSVHRYRAGAGLHATARVGHYRCAHRNRKRYAWHDRRLAMAESVGSGMETRSVEERGDSMTANRYLNAVLTLIAVELGAIALTHTAVPVSAQQRPTPVVITGVELPRNVMLPITVRSVELMDRNTYLPVAVLGQETLP